MFRDRYRIRGVLETLSPLHIGDGDVEETIFQDDGAHVREGDAGWAAAFKKLKKGEKPVEVSTVARDAWGRACIPGSTLKGNLRAWLDENTEPAQAAELLDCMFGSVDLGGGFEFHCARMTQPAHAGDLAFRWWRPGAGTCTAVNVKLRERTRTAEDDKLFHLDFVPEGSRFEVTVTGEGVSLPGIALLLRALESCGRPGGVELGANTGNGWGQVRWTSSGVDKLDEGSARAWVERVKAGSKESHETAYRKLTDAEILAIKGEGTHIVADAGSHCVASFRILLSFEGQFLVNDGSQVQKKTEGREPISHAPLRRKDGRVILPGSSFRGALRSQAGRIWNTMAGGGRTRVAAKDRKGAGWEAKDHEDMAALRPFLRMFGAPGWRAPVSVSDFGPADEADKVAKQEFLAIDRFTGGGADEKKFNAQYALAPRLVGDCRVDLTALAKANAGPWALALLLFLFRDLSEGDVTFGFGASKGYGSCRGELTAVECRNWERFPPGLGDAAEVRKFVEGLKVFPYGRSERKQEHGDVREWVADLAVISDEEA